MFNFQRDQHFPEGLPTHPKVAGAENSHASMRQDPEDELVETGADVTVLPHGEKVLLIRVAEASKQLCWTQVPHSSYVTAFIPKRSDNGEM